MQMGNCEELVDLGLTDLTQNGECSCCGECCSNLLPLYDKEIKTIKAYIKKHNIKPQVHGMVFAEPAIDMACPFMDMSKKLKCSIYEVRPMICRKFICNTKERCKMPRGVTITDVREEFFGND